MVTINTHRAEGIEVAPGKIVLDFSLEMDIKRKRGDRWVFNEAGTNVEFGDSKLFRDNPLAQTKFIEDRLKQAFQGRYINFNYDSKNLYLEPVLSHSQMKRRLHVQGRVYLKPE